MISIIQANIHHASESIGKDAAATTAAFAGAAEFSFTSICRCIVGCRRSELCVISLSDHLRKRISPMASHECMQGSSWEQNQDTYSSNSSSLCKGHALHNMLSISIYIFILSSDSNKLIGERLFLTSCDQEAASAGTKQWLAAWGGCVTAIINQIYSSIIMCLCSVCCYAADELAMDELQSDSTATEVLEASANAAVHDGWSAQRTNTGHAEITWCSSNSST